MLMSYGYRTYRRPDRMVMFAVRYEDGTSAYIRVSPGIGTFGVSPAVMKVAQGAQARGEIQSGGIALRAVREGRAARATPAAPLARCAFASAE